MRQDLQAQGTSIVPCDAEADVYIINTCSVTAKSDYQCRQVIRSAAKRTSGAKVVVTGCYAETRPEELRNIPGVELVISNRDKSTIPQRIMEEAGAAQIGTFAVESKAVPTVHGRTRGFLKIQDGCDNRCSYCIVPLARGNSRSVSPDSVLQEFERLVAAGYPEIVLTGIHIGTYGADLGNSTDITFLLKTLLARLGTTRIRLSSIEPNEITPEMIDSLGNGLCRHLHIPLQSGDDTILASMRRRYTSGFYQELLEDIAARVPGVALGADVMVGFPGEGDKQFQKTMDLIEHSPLTHLHVFSYSPRPGTPAADMPHQVPETIKKERSEALRSLGRKKNIDFRTRNIGKELTVVVEDKREINSGSLTGLTDNYIRVVISEAKTGQIGEKITVRIDSVKESDNYAVIL